MLQLRLPRPPELVLSTKFLGRRSKYRTLETSAEAARSWKVMPRVAWTHLRLSHPRMNWRAFFWALPKPWKMKWFRAAQKTLRHSSKHRRHRPARRARVKWKSQTFYRSKNSQKRERTSSACRWPGLVVKVSRNGSTRWTILSPLYRFQTLPARLKHSHRVVNCWRKRSDHLSRRERSLDLKNHCCTNVTYFNLIQVGCAMWSK